MAKSSHDGDMTLKRLREILAAYGARPERWPAGERDGAHALLAGSMQAREAVTEAARLDDVLDLDPAPAPSPELAARIQRYDIAAAPPGIWTRLGGWLNDGYGAFALRPAALPVAVMLATIVGLGAGLALPQLAGLKTPVPQIVPGSQIVPGPQIVVVSGDETYVFDAPLEAFAETFPEGPGDSNTEADGNEADGETEGAGTLDEFPII